MSSPTYKCPAPGCDREFTAKERQGSKCPCGKVELEVKRKREQGQPGFRYHYVLASDQSIKDPSAQPPARYGPAARGGVKQKHNNETPEIWKFPDQKIFGRMRSVYEIWYIGMQYNGFVYCPSCWTKLWQNIYMDSGGSGIETICHNCKSRLTFHFHSGQRVYHNLPLDKE